MKVLLSICGFLLLLITISCSSPNERNVADKINPNDSIVKLLHLAKDKSNPSRISHLYSALELLEIQQNDSLWFIAMNRLSNLNYSKGNYLEFKKNSHSYTKKALELKDSLQIAKGNYKLGSFYFKTSKYDSAYYHFNTAKELFRLKKDSLQVGRNLLNMAIIQTSVSDYYGSENTSIDALRYLKVKGNKKYKVSIYNNLGIVSNRLGQYEEALHWYNKCLPLSLKNKEIIVLHNNIGIVQRNKKDYSKASFYFKKAFEHPNIEKYPKVKAMVIDNIGYVNFLQGNANGVVLMQEAYAIRKSEKTVTGAIASLLHLGEFYSKTNKLKAVAYFNEALEKTKLIGDTKNRLEALASLADILSDNDYMKKYATLKDSIINKERVFKHQFAKIRYRTSEQESENLILQQQYSNQAFALNQQKNRKTMYLIISTGLLSLLIMGIIYYRQKQRSQKQLALIEKLKALADEKDRLAMHLHDDIASDILIGLQQTDMLLKNNKNNELEKIVPFFERAYESMRKISQGLSVQNFKSIPFEKRVILLCREFGFNADLKIEHNGLESVDWKKVPTEAKSIIHSSIKEAFINIHKHSRASKAEIDFSNSKTRLLIRISDNGIGFSESKEKGIGLLNIKKKLEDINGVLVESKNQDCGAQLLIKIPKYW